VAILGEDDQLRGDAGDLAIGLGDDDGARVAGDLALHAGADEGRLAHEERDALALHVRAHEGAVGVVMLEEWDERSGHGDELLRGDVHVIDAGGFDLEEIATETDGDFFAGEIAVVVDGGVGLADEEGFLAVRGEENRSCR